METILRTLRQWPPQRRAEFAALVLNTMEPEDGEPVIDLLAFMESLKPNVHNELIVLTEERDFAEVA